MADQDETETYHGYSVDAEDQPQTGGVTNADDRGLPEPLDEGYSPPERWSPGQRFGTTALEEVLGESLKERGNAQFLARRARAAVKFEHDLPVEPDAEMLPLRDLGEGRLIWMPQGEPTERPGPLDRIAGRHHP